MEQSYCAVCFPLQRVWTLAPSFLWDCKRSWSFSVLVQKPWLQCWEAREEMMTLRDFCQLLLQPSPVLLCWARGRAGSQAPILVVLQQVQPVALALASFAQLCRPLRGRPRPEGRLLGLDPII